MDKLLVSVLLADLMMSAVKPDYDVVERYPEYFSVSGRFAFGTVCTSR